MRTPCAAIVNHYAVVSLLRRANLLRRSIFSTAGSFGRGGGGNDPTWSIHSARTLSFKPCYAGLACARAIVGTLLFSMRFFFFFSNTQS